jgi:hypothetical protein
MSGGGLLTDFRLHCKPMEAMDHGCHRGRRRGMHPRVVLLPHGPAGR